MSYAATMYHRSGNFRVIVPSLKTFIFKEFCRPNVLYEFF